MSANGLGPYPAYRDSGLGWLGTVPDHWRLVRAKWMFTKMDRPVRPNDEVVTCFRDGTVTLRKNRRELGFTESLREIGYQGVRRGDLVIHAMDAFAGACGVSDSDGKSTPVYSVCTPKDERASSRYYASCVREMARSRWIMALSRGVRERSTDFRFAAFGNQLVPVPPSREQRAIARYLDHADRRIPRYIRAKERLVELLEERKRALIHEAVTGRIDVRTGQPYLAYKDTGVEWLGKVPEHWEVRSLGTFGRFFKGSGGTKADETEQGVPCVRYGDLYTRHQFHITESKACVAPHRAGAYTPVRYGDVLFAGSGETLEEIGKSAVNLIRGSAVCGGDVIVFRPTIDVDAEFVGWSTDCRQAASQKARMGRGITVMHIYSSDLKYLAVPLPPFPAQTAVARFLDHADRCIRRHISATKRQIALLHEYRTRLIADVVTGKLDVREAAARLPEDGPARGQPRPGRRHPHRIEPTFDRKPHGEGGHTMTNWNECPAVERTPGRVSGAWVFSGTRIPLFALYENLASGATVEEFVEWFPGVEERQVRAVLEHEAKTLRTALAR